MAVREPTHVVGTGAHELIKHLLCQACSGHRVQL